MASISEDESVHAEETGTRRRSSRKTNPPIPVTPSRTTRRSKKSEVVEIEEQLISPTVMECVVEETFEPSIPHQSEPMPFVEIAGTNENSVSFPSDNNELTDMTALYDQSSVTNEPDPQTTDSFDNLLANLTEDNANSLPSGDVGSHFASIHEGQDIEFTNGSPPLPAQPLLDDVVMDAECSVEVDNLPNGDSCQAAVEIIDSSPESSPGAQDFLNCDNEIQADEVDASAEAPSAYLPNGDSNVEAAVVESIAESSASSSPVALAEDLPNGDNNISQATAADVDAEMVSEDELPAPTQEKVDDAEEVSDEELPGPKLAELPADTEVVSEDELPTPVKRKVDDGYDPGSPTESSEVPEKKAKKDDDEENSDAEEENRKEEKKILPELDKYWKAVKDDPTDFTGWTYLLQYVDVENDVEATRGAYDAFLSHYPYCYGYWRKYADYEKRKGNLDKCEEVFERGLRAIPLSVDLWIHYLTYVKQNHPDDVEAIRFQFERALSSCGLEFRSDKLWDAYIKWESEAKRISHVVAVYDRLLATPTQGYNAHFDSFQEVVNNNPITSLIPLEEFKRLRDLVRETEVVEKDKDKETNAEAEAEAAEEPEADDHVRNEEEANAVKEKILSSRRKIHKGTVAAVTARWTFEEGIKRPYFHVKPLERCQLKNWKDYLDFEIEQADRTRVLVLFERCLIACALYDDFWLKLIRYLESQTDADLIAQTRDAFTRACTIHHPDKPSLHMLWASFEECQGNLDKAASILKDMDAQNPNLLQIAYRRINLERRRNDLDLCDQLYKDYIATAKSVNAGSLAIKWARFTHKIRGDLDAAMVILRDALEADPSNTRVALQIIDLALHRPNIAEDEIIAVIDSFMGRDGIDLDQKVLFAQRKVEFLEDFGSSAEKLQEAQRAMQTVMSKANEAKKKSELSPGKKTSSKDGSQSHSAAYSNYGQYGSAGSSSSGYYGTTAAAQQYGSASSQPYSDGYGYNQQWQQYESSSGYSGYSQQWSGYGSSGYY